MERGKFILERKIIIGCDPAGTELLARTAALLEEKKFVFHKVGSVNGEAIDYPVVAKEVATAVASGEFDTGILICGTGIGMSIAANKIDGIRAAVCHDAYTAKFTRLHNDSNVLCFGARVTGSEVALDLVDIFLSTEFEGGRHERRVNLITEMENI